METTPVFLSPNAGNLNKRKRGKDEALVVPQQQINLFSVLDFKDFDYNLSFLSEHLAAEFDQQMHEIEQFVLNQGEQFRREMEEKRQLHYRILLATVEKSLGSKFREKEAELKFAGRRTVDLQNQLNRIRSESMAWQAKALSEQTAAASLQAQIQQYSAAAAACPVGEEFSGETRAEDAGSAFLDPVRVENLNRPCLICRTQAASVVLLPCRHLCVCSACDSTVTSSYRCPACGCFRTGSLQVSLS